MSAGIAVDRGFSVAIGHWYPRSEFRAATCSRLATRASDAIGPPVLNALLLNVLLLNALFIWAARTKQLNHPRLVKRHEMPGVGRRPNHVRRLLADYARRIRTVVTPGIFRAFRAGHLQRRAHDEAQQDSRQQLYAPHPCSPRFHNRA